MPRHQFKCSVCGKTPTLDSPHLHNPLHGLLHSHEGVTNNAKRVNDPFLSRAQITNVSGGNATNGCAGGLIYLGIDLGPPPQVAHVVPQHAKIISYGNLPQSAKNWVICMLANGNSKSNVATTSLPANCSNNGQHNTDPRTGMIKGAQIGVYEYYIGGPAGERATARTGPPANTLELFWSTTHIANTYNYHLIKNIP